MKWVRVELTIEKCAVCHFDVSATGLKHLRAALSDHIAYHKYQTDPSNYAPVRLIADHSVKDSRG